MKNIPVLYEDEKFLILNKPAGLPVQGGSGIKVSLDTLLGERYKDRPLLIHRLDKDTSGVIVTAKTREAAAECSAFFSNPQSGLIKTYLALCAGKMGKRGVINEKLFIRGKENHAQTSYKRLFLIPKLPLSNTGDEDFVPVSIMEIQPSTGRMHQIRRHFSFQGNPILGDDKYGDFALNKKLKIVPGKRRLLLHAYSIYLPPPLIKNGLKITAPLPDYFREIAERSEEKLPPLLCSM